MARLFFGTEQHGSERHVTEKTFRVEKFIRQDVSRIKQCVPGPGKDETNGRTNDGNAMATRWQRDGNAMATRQQRNK